MVKYQIDKAIEAGMPSSDPSAKAFWNEVAPQGKKPDPQELIAIIRDKVLKSL